VLEVFEMFMH